MDKTVEERVLDVQAKKRKIVNMAFKEKKSSKARERTSADIKNLLYGAKEGGT